MGDRRGSRNHNWRGGRTVASNGYVLVRVGKDHHLADVRGYAYEHRVVAEQKLGRRLLPGELVHHLDGDKRNNAAENLEVVADIAHHAAHHRKRDDLRPVDSGNPIVACACDCGETLLRYDRAGRRRSFLPGHNTASRNRAWRGSKKPEVR